MKLKKAILSLVSVSVLVSNFSFAFAQEYQKGDVDRDGQITANDAAMILLYSINPEYMPFDDEQKELAKVTIGDGPITVDDVLSVLNKSSNADEKLPIEIPETNYEILKIEANPDGYSLTVTLNEPTKEALKTENFLVTCKEAGNEMTVIDAKTKDNKVYVLSTSHYRDNIYNLSVEVSKGVYIDKYFEIRFECPQLTSFSIVRQTEKSADVMFISDESGIFYYLVVPQENVNTFDLEDEITEQYVVDNGTQLFIQNKENSIKIDGLEKDTAYTLYYVAEGLDEKRSVLQSQTISAKPESTNDSFEIIEADGYEYKYFVIKLNKPTDKKLELSNFNITCPANAGLHIGSVESNDNQTYIVRQQQGYKFKDNNTFTVTITFEDGSTVKKAFRVDNTAPYTEGTSTLNRSSEDTAEFIFKLNEGGKVYYKIYDEDDPRLPSGTASMNPNDIFETGEVKDAYYGYNIVKASGVEPYQWFCMAFEDETGNRSVYATRKQIPEKITGEKTSPITGFEVLPYKTSLNKDSSKLIFKLNTSSDKIGSSETIALSGGNIKYKLYLNFNKSENEFSLSLESMEEPLENGNYILSFYLDNKLTFYEFTID